MDYLIMYVLSAIVTLVAVWTAEKELQSEITLSKPWKIYKVIVALIPVVNLIMIVESALISFVPKYRNFIKNRFGV